MSTTTTPNKPTTTNKPQQPQMGQQPKQQQSPQQQKLSAFNAQNIKDNWKQLTALAKEKWNKLTDQEISRSNGDEQKLTTLVKDRYALNREEANQQVKGFFNKNTDNKE